MWRLEWSHPGKHLAPQPYASVLIPTLNPGPGLAGVLRSVLQQQADFDFEIVLLDSGSSDGSIGALTQLPIRVASIPRAEFRHGHARNVLASGARGEVLLFLSQDAEPATPYWMASLVQPLCQSGVAGAYARQLPRDRADPFARFFLSRTYGPRQEKRRLRHGQSLRLSNLFFSNVSSAIRHDVWQRIPFRRDVVMSEDQYWAYDVLRAGYELVYEPAAQVYHSHNYTLPGLFRRNYLSGASLRGLIDDTPTAISVQGLRYIAAEIDYLFRSGRPGLVPYLLAYELTRSTGFALGMLTGRPCSVDRPRRSSTR